MEKPSAEDECVDSGAETGGSDYSPLSSASSELSMGELQDPFLVSVHLIADPGQGKFLQSAADGVLAHIHPELQLFRVSERAFISQHPRPKYQQSGSPAAACQPALAVILFLQEAFGGEEQILMLHRTLQRPPWRYHHTEKVSNGMRMLPLSPCSQDFFSLAPGTPLWAVRQVHYGKEIVRFTVYCRHENYVDMVRLYKLLLQRRVAQKKEDFCLFVVYSNTDMEIQLSFKRLPRGQSPLTMESTVLEVRVRDVGALVPLLPHPCSPISELRWQTEDYDGNKILLQVQSSHFRHRQHPPHISSSSAAQSASAPSLSTRNAAAYRIRRHHRTSSRPRAQHQVSHSSLPLACDELEEHEQPHQESWRCQWRGHRSSSLFSLPNLGSASSRSTCSSPGPSPNPLYRSCSLNRSSSLIPPFRINVDALIGAEETDVDTGNKVNTCSSVDLTVVSAYIKSNLQWTATPPEDISPSFTPAILQSNFGKASTRVRPPVPVRTNSLSAKSTTATMLRSCPQNTSAAPSLSDVSLNQSDSSTSVSVEERCLQNAETAEEEDDEEEQEFYI